MNKGSIFVMAACVALVASPSLAANIDPRQSPSLPQQQQSAGERALLQKLNLEINNTLQCATSGFALQDQLSAAQAHIKALEEKYEAKTQPTDDPKKPDE